MSRVWLGSDDVRRRTQAGWLDPAKHRMDHVPFGYASRFSQQSFRVSTSDLPAPTSSQSSHSICEAQAGTDT
eukprot:2740946-Rhodomonas_salina.2